MEAASDFYGCYLLIECIGNSGDLLRQFFAILCRFIFPTFIRVLLLLLIQQSQRNVSESHEGRTATKGQGLKKDPPPGP